MDAAGSLAGRSKDSTGWMPMANRGSVLAGWGSGEARRLLLTDPLGAPPSFVSPILSRVARINAFLAVSNQRDHLALRLGVTLGQRWASRRVSGGSRGDPWWLNFVS